MARGIQQTKATASYVNKMDCDQARPSSPPQIRNEVIPEIHKVHQHKIVQPQLEVHPDEVDNFVNKPRAFVEQIVRENKTPW